MEASDPPPVPVGSSTTDEASDATILAQLMEARMM